MDSYSDNYSQTWANPQNSTKRTVALPTVMSTWYKLNAQIFCCAAVTFSFTFRRFSFSFYFEWNCWFRFRNDCVKTTQNLCGSIDWKHWIRYQDNRKMLVYVCGTKHASALFYFHSMRNGFSYELSFWKKVLLFVTKVSESLIGISIQLTAVIALLLLSPSFQYVGLWHKQL